MKDFLYWYNRSLKTNIETRRVKYYTKAIGLWKKQDGQEKLTKAYFKRGSTYFDIGLAENDSKYFNKALNDLNKVIQLSPKSMSGYDLRGDIYCFGKNNNKKAIADYSRAIKLDPKYYWLYIERAEAYFGEKKYSKAIKDYSVAIKTNSESKRLQAQFYNSRGICYYSTGNYNKAINDYNKAIKLVQTQDRPIFLAEIYNNRGKVYKATGECDKALLDFRKVIELKPKCTETQNEIKKEAVMKNSSFFRKALYGTMFGCISTRASVKEIFPFITTSGNFSGEFVKVVSKLSESVVDKNSTVSGAMSKIPDVFPNLDCCIIEIGEISGMLEMALKYLIELTKEKISEFEIYVDMVYMMNKSGVPKNIIISKCSKLLTKKEDIVDIKRFNELWNKMLSISNERFEAIKSYEEFIKSIPDKSELGRKIHKMFREEEYIDK